MTEEVRHSYPKTNVFQRFRALLGVMDEQCLMEKDDVFGFFITREQAQEVIEAFQSSPTTANKERVGW